MSDWIHSYASLRSHPKTRKLSRRIGSIALAIGHLHCLWWWSNDYAKDGDLTKFSAEDIADAAAWDGDADEFVRYLVECGFLDNGDGLRIHDHYEYIGRYIEEREADAERKRLARRESVQRTSSGRQSDGGGTATVERKREREKERLTAPHSQQPVDNSGGRRAKGRGTTTRAAKREKTKSELTPITEYLSARGGGDA